jgi:hypothetical protein
LAHTGSKRTAHSAAHQDHVFSTYLTEGYRSIRKIPDEKSISKIAFLSFHFVVLYFELAGKNQ